MNGGTAENRPSLASEWQTPESNETRFIMSNDPAAERFNPPAPVPCEYCGKLRYTKGFFLLGMVKWSFCGPDRCDCPEAVAAYEREEAEREAREKAEKEAQEAEKMRSRVRSIIGNSGMGARFLERTFANYEATAANQRWLSACKRYADNFRDKLPQNNPDPGRNGLFITGPYGTGKTHLVAAIANQLMQEGTAVICMTMIELLDRIKETYAQSQQYGQATEGDLLSTYKNVPLLIIDDMGKEAVTDWAVSKIYAIINARYEGHMPTIVTTNYSDHMLVHRLTPRDTGDSYTAEATIDRLREMCAGIVTSGDSWRSK